jgi:alpha-D-xyloside xylohydrolase
VTVDAATGGVSFISSDGKVALAEPKDGGKAFDVPSVAEAKTWQVQQTFEAPSDEALYGLGQHQEGIFDLRGVPIRLHQANTNISIPFLLSSKGYGILWNNAALTDFNPADQSIEIDPATGKGRFKTGAKGVYGFLLASDNRRQLKLQVGEQQVIDLQNEWTPTSATGTVSLEANREYEVVAQGGREEFIWLSGLLRIRPHSVQKSERPSTTTSFTVLS